MVVNLWMCLLDYLLSLSLSLTLSLSLSQCFIGLQTYIYTGINIVYRQWPDRHSPRSNVLNSLFIYDHMNLIQPYYFVENYLFQKGFPRRGRLSQDGLANLFKCVCVQWSHFFKKNCLLPVFVDLLKLEQTDIWYSLGK